MPRALRKGLLLAVAAALALAMPLMAQTSTGNIYGTVTDEQGSPIPGGTAMLTGPYAPRTTTVDAAGQFRFIRVPPNTYSIVVTMPGFTTVTREGVLVLLAKDTNVDIKLRISSVQENVVVSGETPLIDTRKVSTGATFGQAELAEIPTARDVYALIQQVPGVQLDQVNVAGAASATAGGPDVSSKGTGAISYLIDGSTVTDNTYGNPFGRQSGGTNTFFDYDTFQNVEITTGGSLLDLANPGVQINVVTKRGTNELKGSARYYYASSNWEANNQSQEAIDQGFTTNSIRFIREYGGELGGPILKDKIWLWAAGSRQDISTNSIAPSAADQGDFASTVQLEPWSAKLNWQVASNNSMNLYYNRSNRIENGAGASIQRPPETRLIFNIPTNFYKAEDNQVFSSSLFASIFLNYQSTKYTQVPQGGLDAQYDYYDYQYHNSYPYYFAKDPQKQANLQVSKFFSTGSLNHELKATFNYRQQIADSATGLPGDQIYGYDYSSSSVYAAITGGVRTTYKTEYYTGTIGDTITAGNFTINAGLRYDYQRGTNLPGYRLANQDFPDIVPYAHFTGNQGYPFTYKTFEPRASVSYGLGANKTTLLRASYAKYADQLGFIVYQMSGVPITSGTYYYWNDANGDHIVQPGEIDLNSFGGYYNVDPSTAPTPPNKLQTDFKTPTTDEFTFGVDQQVTDDFAVSATYTYRKAHNLQYRTPNGTNAGTYDLIGFANGTATAAGNGFTINFNEPYYGLTTPTPPSGQYIFNRQSYNQTYDGIEFSAVKRLSHCWMFRATFGWNNNRQHLTGLDAIYNPNNLWGLGGQNTNDGRVTGYSGKTYVFIGADWQFNVTGMYQLPLGFNLSANLFGRQGYPNPYYVRTRTFDVAKSRPNILIGQVGDYRLNNVYQLDLRLEKTFKAGPVNIIPTAEVFNVTNAGTVLQRYQRVGDYADGEFSQSGLFNTIQETQNPCILRLGLRVNF